MQMQTRKTSDIMLLLNDIWRLRMLIKMHKSGHALNAIAKGHVLMSVTILC